MEYTISSTSIVCSRAFACLLICAALQACSQLTVLFESKADQVEQLLAQQQFYAALDLIDQTPDSDPAYGQLSALRQEVLAATTQFETMSLAAANKQIQQGQWGQALITLDMALGHVPASKPLLARRKQVQSTIEQQLNVITLKLATLRTDTLPGETALLKDRLRYAATEENQQAVDRKGAEANEARTALMAASRQSIKRKQWSDGRRYASLAHHLHADSKSQQLLKQIDEALYDNTLARFKQAIAQQDLLLATQLAARLDQKNIDPETERLIKDLDTQVKHAVEELTREGHQAYSRGVLDLAIKKWGSALALEPSNTELEKRLARAKAFKDNYQRFKQN